MPPEYSEDHLEAINSHELDVDSLYTFVSFPHFIERCKRFGITDADLNVLQLEILTNPLAGKVVQGTNGLRKRRFKKPGSGKGKSESYRVFYVSLLDHGQVILWTILDKHEQDDLSRAARNLYAEQIECLKRRARRTE